MRHALKNALIPAVTMLGLQLGALLGGAVVTETISRRPGLGRLAVEAILSRDFPLVQGTVLFAAACTSWSTWRSMCRTRSSTRGFATDERACHGPPAARAADRASRRAPEHAPRLWQRAAAQPQRAGRRGGLTADRAGRAGGAADQPLRPDQGQSAPLARAAVAGAPDGHRSLRARHLLARAVGGPDVAADRPGVGGYRRAVRRQPRPAGRLLRRLGRCGQHARGRLAAGVPGHPAGAGDYRHPGRQPDQSDDRGRHRRHSRLRAHHARHGAERQGARVRAGRAGRSAAADRPSCCATSCQMWWRR